MISTCSRLSGTHAQFISKSRFYVFPHAHARIKTRSALSLTKVSLYELLGVDSTATSAEIRVAYRRLATIYHPDINPSILAHEKFQAVKQAADVLTSESQRQQYDKHGLKALAVGEYKLLYDFIVRVRAQGENSLIGEPGEHISTVLGLDFGESVTGSACTVTTGALGTCPDCKGSGFDTAARATDCPMCNGRGEITVKKWVQSGEPRVTVKECCPGCKGTGQSELKMCARCKGEGRLQVRRHVRIRVPAGVVDGQVLRVKGQGHCGRYGGAPGDLLVKLQVYNLEDVTRKGDDLYSQLVLSVYEALLGGSVRVKTVRGERLLKVPAGTQHGEMLCVVDAGVARPGVAGVEYGSHYFEVSIDIPCGQTAAAAELDLLHQLADVVRARQHCSQDS